MCKAKQFVLNVTTSTHLRAQYNFVHLLPVLGETVVAGFLIKVQGASFQDASSAIAAAADASVIRTRETLAQWICLQPTHRGLLTARLCFRVQRNRDDGAMLCGF